MNWKKVLQFLWDHHTELIAAGTNVVGFVSFAAEGIAKLLSKTDNGKVEEVTDEMMKELQDSWTGPLPEPDEIFPK